MQNPHQTPQDASGDAPEDTVARRIVMRREIWEQLVLLADALRETRGIEVTPTDVATVALEAGLTEVRRGQGLAAPQAAAASPAKSTAAKRSGALARGKSGAASRSATLSRSAALSRSGALSPSGRARRPAAGRIELSADEQAELEALVSGVDSARGRQRTIALWLGLRRRRVEVEHLRELAVGFDAYNVANFAQNMKKDGLYFEEVVAEGVRAGWRLTAEGKREAKALCKNVLATTA